MNYCCGKWGWIVIATTLIVITLLLRVGADPYRAGDTLTLNVSVSSEDSARLACASNESIGNLRCGFNENRKPQAVAAPLRPFVAAGVGPVLLSGVFENPEIAACLAKKGNSGEKTIAELTCAAVLKGHFATPAVRWERNEKFKNVRYLWVAEAERCRCN